MSAVQGFADLSNLLFNVRQRGRVHSANLAARVNVRRLTEQLVNLIQRNDRPANAGRQAGDLLTGILVVVQENA